MFKVHIVPGWAEGNWHIKQLVKAFPNDFELERDSSKANIIIAHSSGCYSLPKLGQAKLAVIIDPPYWPGRTITKRIIKHVLLDAPKQIRSYGPGFWIRLRAWNFFYIIIQPWQHIKTWRSLKKTLGLSAKANSSLLIRDKQDAYCGPQIKDLAEQDDIKFVEANQLHEDCWFMPRLYVDLMRKELY